MTALARQPGVIIKNIDVVKRFGREIHRRGRRNSAQHEHSWPKPPPSLAGEAVRHAIVHSWARRRLALTPWRCLMLRQRDVPSNPPNARMTTEAISLSGDRPLLTE